MEFQVRNGRKVAKEAVAPGVYQTEHPTTFYIRKRVVSKKTGKLLEISKLIQADSVNAASEYLNDLITKAREGGDPTPIKLKWTFSTFAADLHQRKIKTGAHSSRATIRAWEMILKKHLNKRFGDFFITAINRRDLLAYREELAEQVNAEMLAAESANSRLNVLFTVLNAAAAELELPVNPTAGIKKLPKTRTYTHEEPNALTAEEAGKFLAAMKERFPQHFAFTFLMMMTGLRPSHVRPLRHKGPNADVLWEKGLLLVRRSHTVGQEINNRTKTNHDQALPLPKEVLDVLREHVAAFHTTKEQQDGELLFSKPDGSLLEPQALRHPTRKAAVDAGIPHKVTPKGAGRRTFTSVARAANIELSLVKSITGHLTDAMVETYTARPADQQRAVVGAVVSLVDYRAQLVKPSEEVGVPTPEGASLAGGDELQGQQVEVFSS